MLAGGGRQRRQLAATLRHLESHGSAVSQAAPRPGGTQDECGERLLGLLEAAEAYAEDGDGARGANSGGDQGRRLAPWARRFHRIPTHFLLNVHGI